jgi:hypothetical protein
VAVLLVWQAEIATRLENAAEASCKIHIPTPREGWSLVFDGIVAALSRSSENLQTAPYGLDFATGFGMRNVYRTPNTMVVPFGWASALYSFSFLLVFEEYIQSCARSM